MQRKINFFTIVQSFVKTLNIILKICFSFYGTNLQNILHPKNITFMLQTCYCNCVWITWHNILLNLSIEDHYLAVFNQTNLINERRVIVLLISRCNLATMMIIIQCICLICLFMCTLFRKIIIIHNLRHLQGSSLYPSIIGKNNDDKTQQASTS